MKTRIGIPLKLTPEVITRIHHMLPANAPTSELHEVADALGLTYSTIWHVVRNYCRHAGAQWDTAFHHAEEAPDDDENL